MDLGEKQYISLIRIWNYNKSRIHSFRGARTVEASLDDKLIFRGEIRKSPGNTKDPEQCCEMILLQIMILFLKILMLTIGSIMKCKEKLVLKTHKSLIQL